MFTSMNGAIQNVAARTSVAEYEGEQQWQGTGVATAVIIMARNKIR